EHLLETADALLVGGGMANTFLKASGREVGASLVEDAKLDLARTLLRRAGSKLVLPVDVVIAGQATVDAPRRTVNVADVPLGWRILDVGPRTLDAFAARLRGARTVVWNGPMGVFEVHPFAAGTVALARVVAGLRGATTIVGGGDSAAAVEQAGVASGMTH